MKNKTTTTKITTTKLAMLAAFFISILTLACTEGSVSATDGADADAKETFPQVSVPEGYYQRGSSATMPAALASQLFEADGTPKAAAITTVGFTGNASEYVWVAHVKQFRFDDEAYASDDGIAVDDIPEDIYNKYRPVRVLQKDENITAYVGFSKTGSLGSGAKLALIYNDYSQEFTRHLSEWNSGTPDDDAFTISYRTGQDDGNDFVIGKIIMHFNNPNMVPDATTFGACTRLDEDDWNRLNLSIDRDTDLCTISYEVSSNQPEDIPYDFSREGANFLPSEIENITVDGGVTFTYGLRDRFYFYPPQGTFTSYSEAAGFFKRLSGE